MKAQVPLSTVIHLGSHAWAFGPPVTYEKYEKYEKFMMGIPPTLNLEP
jgi:hypothetical protein